jgi:hypothetical protein
MFIQINNATGHFEDKQCEEILKLIIPYLWEDEAVLLCKELKSCPLSEAVDWVRKNSPPKLGGG